MILVTGASGLVGNNLVRALLQKGCSVRAMVRQDAKPLHDLEIEIVSGDVRDFDRLVHAFEGIEVVYHLAAEISLERNSWSQVQAINVLGTQNVVDACRQCGVRRLIYFSSIHAFRQSPFDAPIDESRPLVCTPEDNHVDPSIAPYDRSKALGEAVVRRGVQKGLNAVILNPTGLIGPYDAKPSFLGRALILLARGKIPALVSGGFDWVDVRDVVDGSLRAEQVAEPGSRYILGGNWASVRDVANLVASETGRSAPFITVPLRTAIAAAPLIPYLARFTGGQPIFTEASLRALDSNRQINHQAAVRDLGYKVRPLAETVRDALAWFNRNHYL